MSRALRLGLPGSAVDMGFYAFWFICGAARAAAQRKFRLTTPNLCVYN